MRILEVIAIFQRAAGTSVFCAEVARELAARGHEVRIAVPDVRAEGMYETEVPLVSIAEAMSEAWDVVHIHGIWTPVLTRVQRWARAKGIRLVWSPHGMLQARALRMKWPKKLVGLALYQWWSLHRADAIHVCSESERQNVARLHFGVPLVTIPLGIHPNTQLGKMGQASFANFSDRTDSHIVISESKTILYLGRINRGKGLVNLLRAWRQLKSARPDLCASWRIRIVGFNEENHLEELYAECDKLNLSYAPAQQPDLQSNNLKSEIKQFPSSSVPLCLCVDKPQPDVTFLGPVYGEAKDAVYASADLFVLPSLSENFSSVLLEALVAGVPSITTSGTPWKMLPEVGCGWYVPVGVPGLVAALSEALALTPDQRRTMGEKGRAWSIATFSWPAVATKLESLYQNLAKQALFANFDSHPPAISHRNTRCVDRAGKYFLEYAG